MRSRDEHPWEESTTRRLAALLRRQATESVDERRDRYNWNRFLAAVEAERPASTLGALRDALGRRASKRGR